MMLEVKKISKHFGGIVGAENCSFQIRKNTITAIIGPNGSGKSTIFNIISGIEKEDGGQIYLNGSSISNLSDVQRASAGISRTFQDVRLFRNLTLQDHIEIAVLQQDQKLLKSLTKPEHISTSKSKEILKRVHLEKDFTTLATDLSYGQRKLLDLAMAIAKPHDILLLDEPVAGVNPKIRSTIKSVLQELKKKHSTIVIIEHDMNFVMELADHIIVMDAGKVIVEGLPHEIKKNKKVLDAYLGA